jgi:hypothetical protein
MNYIWEAVTKKRLCRAELSDVSFVPAQNFSPYMEVNTEFLNETRIADGLTVHVNPFVRFHEIFGYFHDSEFTEFPAYRAAVFDMLFHMLLYTDKKSGYDLRAVKRLFVKEDIEGDVYGKENRNLFALLSEEEKELITDGLLTLYDADVSLHLHGTVMKRLFPCMISYFKMQGERMLLIYLEAAKTEEVEAVAMLCEKFFLPADLKVKYYFDKHFGIFGIDETMKIGEMVLV